MESDVNSFGDVISLYEDLDFKISLNFRKVVIMKIDKSHISSK